MASLVPKPGLKPNCASDIMSFSEDHSINVVFKTEVKTLTKLLIKVISLFRKHSCIQNGIE
jgi:hypothetical protein